MKKKIGMIAALFCMGCLVAEPVTVIKAAEIQVAAAQTTLSADNSLEVLSLSAGTLSPDFTGKTVQYTATVPNDVTSVTVTATPVNEFATVESITGNDNLQVGTNTIKVVVKAQNGALAQYTITLTREDGQAADGAAEQPADGTDGQNTDQPADTADGQNTDQPADAADGQVTDQPVDGTTDQSTEADAADDEDTSNMEYLQQQYNDLSEQYTKEKSFSRNMMGIMAFVIAVLVVIIVNLLLRGRRTDDWDEEDDDDWESAEKRRNAESEDTAGMEEDDHVIEEDLEEENPEEEEDIEPERKGFFHRKSRDAEKTEETEEDETENEIGVTKIHKVHAGLFGQGMSDDLDDEDWDDEEEFSPVERKMPKEKPEEEQRPEKKQRTEEKQKPEKKQRPEEKQRPERKHAPEKKHVPREEEEDDDLEIIDLNDL